MTQQAPPSLEDHLNWQHKGEAVLKGVCFPPKEALSRPWVSQYLSPSFPGAFGDTLPQPIVTVSATCFLLFVQRRYGRGK